ncbi:hypothetical protein ACWGLG_16165 [Streptomyces antimycoticus]
MTTEPAPIRRSDLPCIPPPESEIFTWFPHPDGGGDMVRGQRQRGVQVRRRVTYGDWEPVRPDRWADDDEPTCDHDSQVIDHEGVQYWACMKCGENLGGVDGPAASNDTTDALPQSPHRTLLARLEQEQAHYAEAAARTRIDECVISHSSKAHAFKIAAAHLLAVFEGAEAANAYMRDEASARTEADVTIAVPVIEVSEAEVHTSAVDTLAQIREYVETSDDDGIRTRETVLRMLGESAPEAPAQRLQRLQVARLLEKVRRNQQADAAGT